MRNNVPVSVRVIKQRFMAFSLAFGFWRAHLTAVRVSKSMIGFRFSSWILQSQFAANLLMNANAMILKLTFQLPTIESCDELPLLARRGGAKRRGGGSST
jgi:hypothetical protein